MASLLKNVASQNITFTLVSATTGAALTSATFTSLAWVTKDNTQAGFAGTFTTLGNGQYNYAPTQAETNCTDFGLLVTVSGAIPVNLDFHTDLATPLTGAQVATAVWQDTTAGDFTVASSIGKSLFTSGAVPGASGGLFIAGSNAATTVNFTGNLSGSVGSVTGAVGSVTGSVGSISGVTFPTNFSSLSINGSGYVTITSDIKQGVSATVVFTMTDSTTHAPKTGIGSSFTRNEIYKGGGAGAGTTNTPSEVGDGWYSVVLTSSETNATSIALTFEASGADQLNMLLIPQA